MTPEERAARERKQKIFVAVGGLFLVLLLAIQVPRLLSRGSESAAAPTTKAADTVATTGGATTTPSPSPSAPTRAPAGLVDTDRPFQAGPGQLSSFNVFSGKDPFVQQVQFDDGATASSGGGGTGGSSDKDGSKPSSKKFAVGTQPSAAVTVVSVNGARQALVPGTAFPASDPVFVLVAEQPQAKTVSIAVAGGAYASGSKTTKLRIGKPLVLVNTTTGARYRLVLVSVGNGEAKTSETSPSESSKSKKP